MANANWTPAQIDDEDLRAFIEALAAEGFAGMKPDFEFGISFTPMTGSEAGLRRVIVSVFKTKPEFGVCGMSVSF